jgi:hypothetical protein
MYTRKKMVGYQAAIASKLAPTKNSAHAENKVAPKPKKRQKKGRFDPPTFLPYSLCSFSSS